MQEIMIGALCGLIGQLIVYPDTCVLGRLTVFFSFFLGGCETVETITDLWDDHVKGWL